LVRFGMTSVYVYSAVTSGPVARRVSKDIKTLLREAAEEVGFIQRVPVLDEAGKPSLLSLL
jgi:hypothetical protein